MDYLTKSLRRTHVRAFGLLWLMTVSTKSMFHVFYSPRATHAEFVIPYEKYITSIRNPICIGTRFIMRFEMNDSPERRCAGVVAGVYDLDPYRWPNSKWRCLLVRWDESCE
ncbi:auxin response factor 4 [Arabidopsis lyrata subsp. lyrata]|uniref:auxin response factor 4 n=1 Tax=Arabidopsis lyrata subsp. lyrata TaxID=81972 RepID=UPI000A29D046|nr:auxin response factor 4 [Arabidopsis lyrata subsp. lyrata]|eukprot:XP_020886088.1 auxin response factor 4 [Arabidopsis lyrata subsp. lyrata]